jgi:hypothetical protein
MSKSNGQHPEGPRFFSRDQIRAVADVKTVEVFIPDWGAYVRVRGMTAAERDQFEEAAMVERGDKREMNLANYRARLAVWSLVDEDGHRLFTEDDAAWLGEKSVSALNHIMTVAHKLNATTAADVEELVGGLKNGQVAALPSS